jgi:hypothetical protein
MKSLRAPSHYGREVKRDGETGEAGRGGERQANINAEPWRMEEQVETMTDRAAQGIPDTNSTPSRRRQLAAWRCHSNVRPAGRCCSSMFRESVHVMKILMVRICYSRAGRRGSAKGQEEQSQKMSVMESYPRHP